MEIYYAYWLRFWHCLYFTFKDSKQDHRLKTEWTYGEVSHIACVCGRQFYHEKFIDIYNRKMKKGDKK